MTSVLVVEDNQVYCNSMAFDLEMRGYAVAQAYDGTEALAHIQTAATLPDIILSDISMPDMDGYQLLAAVRRNEEWRDIPFLFLTAHDSLQAVRTGKELGVDDYLVKPFEVDDLVVAMESKLHRLDEVRRGAERRLDKTREQFLNLISHELRTPLTPIVGGTELLAESIAATSDESVLELLGLVQAGAERLQRLLNNVQLYTELNGGNLKPQLDRLAHMLDFGDVVQEACRTVAADRDFAEKRIGLEYNGPPGPIYVRGIRNYLLALVAEPLRNAYIFSPAGGRVVVRVQQNGAIVAVTITDQGRGIAADKLPNLWKPFEQVDRHRYEQQGVGIGLSITRAAAQLHGGSCAIDTVEGEGVRFTASLPLADG